jgi:hypothetical protein
MDHNLYTEWLQLSVHGELDPDKQAMLDKHIRSCNECRRERDELERMLESIRASGAGEPTDEQLITARQRLRAALWDEPSAGAAAERRADRRESLLSRWFRGYRLALAGAATLLIGFFAGYLVVGGAKPVTPPQVIPLGEEFYADVSNVRFLNADAGDGQIELQYDQIRPMRFKASMDDERMRRLLADAIVTCSNPGVRLQAINLIETEGGDTPNSDIKRALIGALLTDPNAGVRRSALLALQQLPYDNEIKETLMFVLDQDENPGIRVAAMNYLTAVTLERSTSEGAYYDILDSRRR